MMSYSALRDGLQTDEQASFFLEKTKRRTGSLDCITAGFMCAELETRLAAAELVLVIERNPCW